MADRIGLWLFHGGEAYLVDRAFQDTWSKLTADLDSELDRELLDASTPADQVVGAASSVGFFAPARVVGVRDWKVLSAAGGRRKSGAAEPELAAALLAQLPSGAGVVLSATGTVAATHPVLRLARERGTAQEFPKLRFQDIDRWVERRAREIGLKTRAGALQALTQAVGDDLRLLDGELQKLDLYADGGTIGVEEVRALVPDSAEHQIWDLTDALLVDPARAALELERALASEQPPPRLSYMLVRHIRLVLAASDAPSGPAGVKALSEAMSGDGRPVSEYSARKAQNQARAVEKPRLEALYRRAAAVEAASRRGDIRDTDALRLLVLGAAEA